MGEHTGTHFGASIHWITGKVGVLAPAPEPMPGSDAAVTAGAIGRHAWARSAVPPGTTPGLPS